MCKKYSIILIFLIIVFLLPPQMTSAKGNSAGAVVLVNSESENRFDFDCYLKLYIDYFDIAYTVVDIAGENLPDDFNSAALLVIGHKGVLAGMNIGEQKNIERYIEKGGGLFSFDQTINPGRKNNIIQNILGFNIGEPVKIQEKVPIKFKNKDHYITAYKVDRPDIETAGTRRFTTLAIPNVTGMSSDADILVSIADVPLVVVKKHREGRIVQWTTYEWMDANVLGFYNGLDDIVWRSLVWSARKPFVFQGNIPLVGMRIDDCVGQGNDFAYIDIINKYGIIPHIAFMMDSMPPSAASKLGEYTHNGNAEAFVHSRTLGEKTFMYYDFDINDFKMGKPFIEETLKKNFADLNDFHKKYNIRYALTACSHWGAIGTNVLPYLRKMGVNFHTGPVTHPYTGDYHFWPYQLYQRAGRYESVFGSYNTGLFAYHPNMIIDYVEKDKSMFATISRTPSIKVDWLRVSRAPGYKKTRKVEGMIIDGTNMLRHHLDSMGPAYFFTHEINIDMLEGGLEGLDRAFEGVIANLKKFHNIIPCGLDYINQYGKSIYTADLESAYYDKDVNKLMIHWNGFSDIPTKFHVFTEEEGKIVDNLHDLQVFRGPKVAEVHF